MRGGVFSIALLVPGGQRLWAPGRQVTAEAGAGGARSLDDLRDGQVLVTKVSGVGEFLWIDHWVVLRQSFATPRAPVPSKVSRQESELPNSTATGEPSSKNELQVCLYLGPARSAIGSGAISAGGGPVRN